MKTCFDRLLFEASTLIVATSLRSEVHLASIAAVEVHTTAAVESAEMALAAAAEAREEIRYRRGGLLVALAFILAAIIALMLKIREIERS